MPSSLVPTTLSHRLAGCRFLRVHVRREECPIVVRVAFARRLRDPMARFEARVATWREARDELRRARGALDRALTFARRWAQRILLRVERPAESPRFPALYHGLGEHDRWTSTRADSQFLVSRLESLLRNARGSRDDRIDPALTEALGTAMAEVRARRREWGRGLAETREAAARLDDECVVFDAAWREFLTALRARGGTSALAPLPRFAPAHPSPVRDVADAAEARFTVRLAS